MKKIISLALLLSLFAFANPGSFYSENNDISAVASVDGSKLSNREFRNSFFMSFDLGLLLTFTSDVKDQLGSVSARDLGLGYWNAPTKGSYSGEGLGIEAKFGVLLKQFVAVYAMIGAFETDGTFEMTAPDSIGNSQKFSYDEATSKHAYIGSGVIVYPFRDDTGYLDGIYFGLGFGFDLGGISYEYETENGYSIISKDEVATINTRLQIEFGKEFNVGERWKLGVSFIGARFATLSGGDDCTNYSVQLSFHVTRR